MLVSSMACRCSLCSGGGVRGDIGRCSAIVCGIVDGGGEGVGESSSEITTVTELSMVIGWIIVAGFFSGNIISSNFFQPSSSSIISGFGSGASFDIRAALRLLVVGRLRALPLPFFFCGFTASSGSSSSKRMPRMCLT